MKNHKSILSLVTVILFLSCSNQNKKIQVVRNFADNISNSKQYQNLVKSPIKQNNIKIIDFNVEILKKKLNQNPNFKILNYDEFHSDNKFSDFKIEYMNHDNVFYLINDNKLITHVIINDNNKIISFFQGDGIPRLVKNTRKNIPIEKTIKPYIIN